MFQHSVYLSHINESIAASEMQGSEALRILMVHVSIVGQQQTRSRWMQTGSTNRVPGPETTQFQVSKQQEQQQQQEQEQEQEQQQQQQQQQQQLQQQQRGRVRGRGRRRGR